MKSKFFLALIGAVGLACLAQTAQASIIGDWQGAWYWDAPSGSNGGPFSLDVSITSITVNPDLSETLFGTMQYDKFNGTHQAPVAWLNGSVLGNSIAFGNVLGYDYTGFLNHDNNVIVGEWFPSLGSNFPGADAGKCTANDLQQGYCGSFELYQVASAVPEPASLGLAALAVAMLASRRRRH